MSVYGCGSYFEGTATTYESVFCYFERKRGLDVAVVSATYVSTFTLKCFQVTLQCTTVRGSARINLHKSVYQNTKREKGGENNVDNIKTFLLFADYTNRSLAQIKTFII